MLSVAPIALGFTAPLAPVVQPVRGAAVKMETVDDLKAIANKANPVIGYWCAPASMPRASASVVLLGPKLCGVIHPVTFAPCALQGPHTTGLDGILGPEPGGDHRLPPPL
eukprot:scaffold160307_cov27-Tisochrysis_lutea.AAC.1